MDRFIRKHSGLIDGVVSGFDRLVFRGTLRTLSHVQGMKFYVSRVGALLKEFGGHTLRPAGELLGVGRRCRARPAISRRAPARLMARAARWNRPAVGPGP